VTTVREQGADIPRLSAALSGGTLETSKESIGMRGCFMCGRSMLNSPPERTINGAIGTQRQPVPPPNSQNTFLTPSLFTPQPFNAIAKATSHHTTPPHTTPHCTALHHKATRRRGTVLATWGRRRRRGCWSPAPRRGSGRRARSWWVAAPMCEWGCPCSHTHFHPSSNTWTL
jgi:hypothetical protein